MAVLSSIDAGRDRAIRHDGAMANELELFYWWFYDDMTGQRLRTSCAMDRATATLLYGNVQRDEPTRVVRTLYQPGQPLADLQRSTNLQPGDERGSSNAAGPRF